MDLDTVKQTMLMQVARRALTEYATNRKCLRLEQDAALPEELSARRGVFVTLWRQAGPDVRASKGLISPKQPLIPALIDTCIGTIAHDAIFPTLEGRRQEIDSLVVQISLLDPPEEVRDRRRLGLAPDHALMVSIGRHTGVFLPELIEMARWDTTEALSQLCLKSGLPGNMWRDDELRVFTMRVSSFAERSPGSWEVCPATEFLQRARAHDGAGTSSVPRAGLAS